MIHSPRWLKIAILGFVAAVTGAALLKYALFLYDGLDLAIYNQVMWHTVAGDPFGFTIHPHSYLGDHAEFLLMALAPFYAFWLDPRTLLILQTLALGGGAWLLWRVAVARADSLGAAKAWGLRAAALVTVLYLASPTVADIGLFEFHFLPFALIPLLAAALAYERRRLWPFAAWLAVACLVREDVALAVIGFAALALLERRRWAWAAVPAIIAAAGFTLGVSVIEMAGGTYKFATYYAWLGNSPAEAIGFMIRHPLAVLLRVLSVPNLEFVLGLLQTALFLPLLAPRRLVLAAVPLAQYALNVASTGDLVVRTHYATLFLPALYLAAIDGLLTLPRRRLPSWLPLDRADCRRLALPVFTVALFWNAATLGPWLGLACRAADRLAWERAALARAAVAAVPADAGAAASYALLPALSSRESVYSLHYLFFGSTQFGAAPYAAPEDLTHLAVDAEDFATWRTQARATGWLAAGYKGGQERLRLLAGQALWHDGPFAVYERLTDLPSPWTEAAEASAPQRLRASVSVRTGAAGRREVIAMATWSKPADADDYLVCATLTDRRGLQRRAMLPLVGLSPMSTETSEGVTTELSVPIDGLPSGDYRLRLELERRQETMRLGPALNAVRAGEKTNGWQDDDGLPLRLD